MYWNTCGIACHILQIWKYTVCLHCIWLILNIYIRYSVVLWYLSSCAVCICKRYFPIVSLTYVDHVIILACFLPFFFFMLLQHFEFVILIPSHIVAICVLGLTVKHGQHWFLTAAFVVKVCPLLAERLYTQACTVTETNIEVNMACL